MSDEMKALLPCPFCGSEPLFVEPAEDNWHTYSILCEGCAGPLRPMQCVSQDRDACIAAWNTRAAIEATTVKGDGLVERLREYGNDAEAHTYDRSFIVEAADTITTLKGEIERLTALVAELEAARG